MYDFVNANKDTYIHTLPCSSGSCTSIAGIDHLA